MGIREFYSLKDEETAPIATLLTDFGRSDSYVAAVKGVSTRVVHIDCYGNLVTNLPTLWLNAGQLKQALVGNNQACHCVSHDQELEVGEVGVLPGSLGTPGLMKKPLRTLPMAD